jgi:hypothetical protein
MGEELQEILQNSSNEKHIQTANTYIKKYFQNLQSCLETGGQYSRL